MDNIQTNQRIYEVMQQLHDAISEFETGVLDKAYANPSISPETLLKALKMAYTDGRECVLNQLSRECYEFDYDVEETYYGGGFEISFSKEVEIEVDTDDIINEFVSEMVDEDVEEHLMTIVAKMADWEAEEKEEEVLTDATHQS